MTDPTSETQRRLRRLEDRVEIGELIARYGLAMDDRDMAAMQDLFTPEIVIRSLDGGLQAIGRAAVIAMYARQFKLLGPSNHFSHDRIISFDDAAPDRAQGLILSHAEMSWKGAATLTAIRYRDTYHRQDGHWRFGERLLAYMYFVPVADYLDAFGPGLSCRNRATAAPRAADWPEPLPSWKRFYGIE